MLIFHNFTIVDTNKVHLNCVQRKSNRRHHLLLEIFGIVRQIGENVLNKNQ